MKNKWNQELLYSIIFFVVAHIWFFLNPLDQIIDLIESSPNALAIKYKLFDLGIFPIFYNTANIAVAGFIFFLFCSIYAGISSLRKASVEGERKIFGFIPRTTPGTLASILVFISSFAIILLVTEVIWV